jgi:TPR repeat protein
MPLKLLPALIALGLATSPSVLLAMDSASEDATARTSAGDGARDVSRGAVDIAVREEAARRPGAPASELMALAEHYEQLGDHRRAAEWYNKASVAGDTRAQIKVAETLMRASTHAGLSEAQRERARTQGMALLRHAAQARNAEAAYRLHLLHADGVPGAPHDDEAERWLKTAADAGHPQASFAMAQRLLATSNAASAVPFLERAATGGHPEALRRLVAHHLEQTPPAVDAADRWARKAVEQGDVSLEAQVSDAREREAQRISAAEREAAARRDAEAAQVAAAAREAQPRPVAAPATAIPLKPAQAASAGPLAIEDDASMSLALDAPAATPQPSMSDLLAEIQAMRGELTAMQQLLAERDGHIASLQAELAREQEHRQAAAVAEEARRKNESGLAAFRAGDHAAAFSRFDAAARAGNAQAMNNLATLYMNGQGVARSTERAIEYFTLSANAGNAQAAANLGNLYARGTDGVERDSAQAEDWYRRAEMLGHAKASEYLRAFEAQRVAGN